MLLGQEGLYATLYALFGKRSCWYHNVNFITNGTDDVEYFGKAQENNVPIVPEPFKIMRHIIGE